MLSKVYEINNQGIKGISDLDVSNIKSLRNQKQSIFLIDIQTSDRNLAAEILDSINVHEGIQSSVLEPKEHIRFEYFDDVLYGELAYFSIRNKIPSYTSVLISENIVFAIHDKKEGIIRGIKKSISSLNTVQLSEIKVEYLLYVFVTEILSEYGKLIIEYRDEIEDLAVNFDKKHFDVKPSDFLEAKSELSNFSRVLEKLFFALSFPPAREMIDTESPYRIYFNDLQKNLNLIQRSLAQTEERLNSLNDHYQLMLQDRSNSRLRFLTIIQAVFVPLTLIAGIYGMNFKFMPLIDLTHGYYYSLGIMLLSAVIFLWYFYKNGWFK